MNVLPSQEIKRRGISAVDEALQKGPVHIIKNNYPQYVVLTEERFQELLDAEQIVAIESIRASLEDAKAGRVERYDDIDSLMVCLERDEE